MIIVSDESIPNAQGRAQQANSRGTNVRNNSEPRKRFLASGSSDEDPYSLTPSGSSGSSGKVLYCKKFCGILQNVSRNICFHIIAILPFATIIEHDLWSNPINFRAKVILLEVVMVLIAVIIVMEEIEKAVIHRAPMVIQDTVAGQTENAKDPEDQGSHRKKRIIMAPKTGQK